MKFSWKAVFLLLPPVWFLLFGWTGFSDTDAAFIPGLSWRILQGEIPHQDFAYVRPPLTLYFHAGIQALLPEQWETLGERALFFLMMAASSFFFVFAFKQISEKYIDSVDPWFFAALGFLLSVHNFPPMPWHTVDGIFFSSIGVYLLSPFSGKDSAPRSLFLGLVFLLLSALCKQPFALLLPVFGGMSFILNQKKPQKAQVFAFFVLLLFTSVGFIYFLPDFISAMLRDISGETSLKDLLHAGIISYGKWAPFALPVLAGVLFLFKKSGNYFQYALKAGLLIFFVLLSANVALQFYRDAFRGLSTGTSQYLFLISAIASLLLMKSDSKAGLWLLLSLLPPWCASISWGYENPSLGASALLLPAFLIFREIHFSFNWKPAFFSLTLALIVALNYYPYRDANFLNCNQAAGEIFPVLKGIRIGNENAEKLREFKSLSEEFNQPLIVVPGFPHAHYLLRKKSPIGSDWEHNAEMNFSERQSWFQQQLGQKVQFVFLEKGKEKQLQDRGKWGSDFSLQISLTWIKIKEGRFFTVYQNPG